MAMGFNLYGWLSAEPALKRMGALNLQAIRDRSAVFFGDGRGVTP